MEKFSAVHGFLFSHKWRSNTSIQRTRGCLGWGAGLSMNPRVLPASCRQNKRRKALPARCRQHLGGAVSFGIGSWSQCIRKNERRLSMNRLVAQTFQPAGSPDFRVRWTPNGRLESRPNPQARKPALRTRLGSWSQCAPHMACRLSMNRSAELQLGAVWRAPNAPTWRSALQAHSSWSQCVREGE